LDGDIGGGAARLTGASDGCFIQTYTVKPGEQYAVRVKSRQSGQTPPYVRIRWQTPDSAWTAWHADVPAFPGKPDANGWSELFCTAIVPETAGKLVLLLGATNQEGGNETAWFDDVEVYRLP
jgi:hypothetical protein